MTAILAAVGMLTRLPVASRPFVPGRPRTGAAAFGIVGTLLGAAAALPVLLLPGAPLVAAILAVASLAALSGALHLDGLADTADALAAPSPARAEAARTDPRLGAAGTVAVVAAFSLDAALVAALVEAGGAPTAALAVVIAAAGSRALAPLLARLAGASVRPGGSARWFVSGTSWPDAAIALASATGVALGAAWVSGRPGLAAGAALGGAVALLAAGWLVRRRGGLDGDLFGAVTEIGFAAIALAILAAVLALP